MARGGLNDISKWTWFNLAFEAEHPRIEIVDGFHEVLPSDASNEVRDRVTKRHEYTEATIPEYWIVDPETQTIAVLALGADGYDEHAVLARGDTVVAAALPGLTEGVAEVFDAD